MSESSTTTCEKCNAELKTGDIFCSACGAGVSGQSTEDSAAPAEEKPAEVKKAATWILVIAIMFAVLGTVFGLIQNSQADEARKNLAGHPPDAQWSVPVNGKTVTVGELREMVEQEVRLVFILNYLLAAIMLGLYFWARRSPLPAIVTALCVYLAVIVINAIIDPTTLVQGIIIKAIFIGAMVAGIKTALNARRLTDTQEVAS